MSRHKIVLCEDEFIIGMDLVRSLKKFGYEVAGFFPSAEEALRSMDKLRPELLITDHKLKGIMSGIELAQIAMNKYSSKVILLSAHFHSIPANSENFLHVPKPFEIQEVISKIELLLQ